MAVSVMRNGIFDEPVYAGRGRYLVEEISSVEEALDYLEVRSFDESDVIATVTWQALSRCLEGKLLVSAARETFYRMLKKKGMLAEPRTTLIIGQDQARDVA
ncbi:DUF982 domain-containing protein [Rhizobium sp. BT-175]|uniref:DUF982 domain-containing protein n=1 Tax=Rhizobium sp. BT-175 TaxID=2986929 RepID=UPI002235AB1F|nr:DUF982 domain-containing protein [Rhizobium sp. BT-175]MCV9947484.1 DUF982 domain-containing protein [Rhizobium sp. BT-175]